MYELTLPDNCTSDCYDALWYSLLKYYDYEYEAFNIKYWYTAYHEFIGNMVYFKRKSSSVEYLLNNFYGINIFYNEVTDNTDLRTVIADDIKYTPVGVFIDPYYLEWTTFYNQTHYTHVLLIVDINPRDKTYICFDVYYNKTGYLKVDFDVVNNYCTKYFTHYIGDNRQLTPNILKKELYSLLNSYDTDCSYLEQLIRAFKNNAPRELFTNNLRTSTTLINLMKISEDKRNFTHFLNLLESKTENFCFADIKDKLLESEKKLMIIKSILTKYAITGKLNETDFRKIMLEIIELDADIKCNLLHYCTQK